MAKMFYTLEQTAQKLGLGEDEIKELAKEKKCLLADLNTDMQAALKTFPADSPKGKQLTIQAWVRAQREQAKSKIEMAIQHRHQHRGRMVTGTWLINVGSRF